LFRASGIIYLTYFLSNFKGVNDATILINCATILEKHDVIFGNTKIN